MVFPPQFSHQNINVMDTKIHFFSCEDQDSKILPLNKPPFFDLERAAPAAKEWQTCLHVGTMNGLQWPGDFYPWEDHGNLRGKILW